MTDSNKSTIENASESAPQEAVGKVESSVASNDGAESPAEEKLLKQSEVNRLVGGVKVEAYGRGRREALAESQTTKKPATQEESNKSITLSEDELYKMVENHSEQLASRKKAGETVEQFTGKMHAGMQKYKDFEEVVGSLDIPNLPGRMIDFANSMDNTADVMYELGKNPSKFASVLMLSHSNPKLAKKEFERLSGSIKRNSDASEQGAKSKVNEPLSQVKSSITGTDNGECKTVGDFRKQPWLRG